MAVWRLQLITAGSSIVAYCIQNHVAAMGAEFGRYCTESKTNDYGI